MDEVPVMNTHTQKNKNKKSQVSSLNKRLRVCVFHRQASEVGNRYSKVRTVREDMVLKGQGVLP